MTTETFNTPSARRFRIPAVIATVVAIPVLALGLASPAGAVTTGHAGAASTHKVAAKKATHKVTKKATKKVAKKTTAAHKSTASSTTTVQEFGSTSVTITASLFANSAYPYAAAQPTGGDNLNMGVRQCTSYAAWALTREGVSLSPDPMGGADVTGSKGTAELGDASTWAAAAKSAGYTVNSTPTVGAIAQWNSNESSSWTATSDGQPGGTLTAGEAGHVGVVVAVNADGSALIQDYNGWVSVGYSQHSERAPRYIHIAA